MDKIREQSGTSKSDRSKTFDAIKKHQEVVSAKIKEITALRAKLPFRSGNDIQARISQLNEQVESGTMKLIDEKKALNEISQLRRSNKTVASIDQLEKEVETEKAKIDALKKVLDDPEVKKTFAKLDELSKEMDKLRDQGQKLHDQRGSLMDKRRELSGQMVCSLSFHRAQCRADWAFDDGRTSFGTESEHQRSSIVPKTMRECFTERLPSIEQG